MADTEADAAPADDLPDAEPLDAVDVQPRDSRRARRCRGNADAPAEAPRTVAPVTNVPAAAHAEAPSPETADPTADVVADARKKLEEIDKLMKDTVAMTEGVTQAAAMPVAVHGPSGGRHGRRDEDAAGAFGEALGTSNAPHRAETGAAAKSRANAWRQTASRPGAETAAIDDAQPKDGHCVKVVIDGKLTLTGSPDQPDDADAR